MKKMVYTICDCEHEGDISSGERIVITALRHINSNGHIISTKWSGEDGENAYVFYEVEEDKVESILDAINKAEDGEI